MSAVAIAITGGVGVFAGLNATAYNTSALQATTGTLKLTLGSVTNSGGFSTAISNLIPGDTVNRYVTLTSEGTLDNTALDFKVTATGDSALTSGSKALKVSVTNCSSAWTFTAGTSTSSCGGTTTTVVASDTVSAFSTAQAFSTITSLAASSTLNLKVAIVLPDATETTVNGVLPSGTIQGATANLTFTFSGKQRTANESNS